jgi:hypothetical protein
MRGIQLMMSKKIKKEISEKDRLDIVFSVVELAHKMYGLGFPKAAYSRILRETIFFVWEIRERSKHSHLRARSKAAEGLLPSQLDYDHAVPMRIVIEMILNKSPDRQAAEDIIRRFVHGVLITKEEHEYLRENGLSSKMPADWDGKDWTARYREVGITLAGQEMSRGPESF